VVQSAAEFLKQRTQHYLFVSSVAAYDGKEFAKADIGEDAPIEPWNGSGRPYNRNKAESERRLHQIIGERLTIVRPGPIKGHRDGTVPTENSISAKKGEVKQLRKAHHSVCRSVIA
jgi:nucleoside-diphosphate-sugar epimerase